VGQVLFELRIIFAALRFSVGEAEHDVPVASLRTEKILDCTELSAFAARPKIFPASALVLRLLPGGTANLAVFGGNLPPNFGATKISTSG
jgi:hypothetical protein